MTILPADFGNSVGHVDWAWIPIVLPCIEIPQQWCDGEDTTKQYHRHRARAHVDVAAGEDMDIHYQLDGALDQMWEENHADSPANDWTSTFALAGETAGHVYEHEPVPNSTAADKSHRFVTGRIKFKKGVGSADTELNGFEFGWPMDNALDASAPVLELGDRTGAHVFDSYHSGSAWHIKCATVGTYQRLLHGNAPRISMVMADDR